MKIRTRTRTSTAFATGLASVFWLALVPSPNLMANDELKAYPAAQEGMKRYILQLPPQDTEEDFKVQLIVGKTVETDGVNRHFFAGQLQEQTVEGWGYPMHVLRELGPMAGTLIGVDPNAPKVQQFVTLGGEPNLVRYNSRLPVVVYVPEGVEVRYRIWSVTRESEPMAQG